MITRDVQPLLLKHARGYSALAVTGPQQAGKTTLARVAFPKKA